MLLHQTKKAVGDINDFGTLLQSPRLEDQDQSAALESYANRTFNLVIDLTKALLITRAPQDAATLKPMNSDEVLAAASRQRVFRQAQWEVLDEVRLGRNDLQHESSWVPLEAGVAIHRVNGEFSRQGPDEPLVEVLGGRSRA